MHFHFEVTRFKLKYFQVGNVWREHQITTRCTFGSTINILILGKGVEIGWSSEEMELEVEARTSPREIMKNENHQTPQATESLKRTHHPSRTIKASATRNVRTAILCLPDLLKIPIFP